MKLSKEDINLILDALHYLKNTINGYKTLTNNTKLVTSVDKLIDKLKDYEI